MANELVTEEPEEEASGAATAEAPVGPAAGPEPASGTTAAASPATEPTKAKKPDPNDPNREELLPRLSRQGKVFSNGFKLPGFSGYTDLPGKVCVKCGFNAMKFSKECPRCGGELVPESAITTS